MLRPNGNSGEVRASHCLSLPYCSVDAAQAWDCKGNVFAMHSRYTRPTVSGRQKQSNIKDLYRRCWPSSVAVLDAISAFYKSNNNSPTTNSAGSAVRGWENGWSLDKRQAEHGAGWVNMRCSWAATGTTGRTVALGARTGTTLPRTRTTTSVRGFAVTTRLYYSVNAQALQVGQSKCGQPTPSSLGKYITRFGRTPSKSLKSGADTLMAKKHRNLINKIADIDNIRDAYKKTSNGKKMTFGYLEFKEYAESNLLIVQEELRDGGYKIGEYRQFTVHEPKPRLISALDFKDRLVQHALCNIIGPIFESTLMPNTFACRVGLGTHAGVRFVQSRLRHLQPKYFLKTDYSKFFPSIDRFILHGMIERKIACEKTLQIIREIIPPEGKGIPIGSLTSQLFANVYGNAVDRFIHFELKQREWARYMDDIVVLGDNEDELMDCFLRLSDYSINKLELRIGKWHMLPTNRGINFLGYRIWPTHKLLRKDSVTRAKRKIAQYIESGDNDSLRKFIASWAGHARWADSGNLFKWMENRHGISI